MTRLPSDRKPLGDRNVEELLHMAEEISAMAAAAVTPSAKRSLERLATRFRVFAASRANAHQPSGQAVRPGEPAPSAGLYELRNVFSTWVGQIVQVKQGELLPRAPREFTWILTHPSSRPDPSIPARQVS